MPDRVPANRVRPLLACSLLLAAALPPLTASPIPPPAATQPPPPSPTATRAAEAPSWLPPTPLSPATDRPWQLQSFADSAGISALRIFDLCFTPEGDAWLATTGGLYHYNGYTWRSYGAADGLPSSFVRCVLFARNEETGTRELWVGTDRGAGVFDPARCSYTVKGEVVELHRRSVRHIDQDDRGHLWFSCDRWPDTSVTPGALLRLKRGEWTLFNSASGLPMDYVIGHHQDSRKTHRAFTTEGWVQLGNLGWAPAQEQGLGLESRVLHMEEDADGNLFAQGEGGPLRRIGGTWERLPAHTLALHRTSAGELLAVERDSARSSFWFSRWDGSGFRRLSASVPMPPNALIYTLREAPDGSLWCVGSGIVLRWARATGPWHAYPDLPPPLRRDASGRVWFHGGAELSCLDGGLLHRSAVSYSRILGFDADGCALAMPDGRAGPAAVLAPPNPPTPNRAPAAAPTGTEPCPLASVSHSSNDALGRLWLLGPLPADRPADPAQGPRLALCHRQAGSWVLHPLPQSQPGTVMSLRPDGADGVSLTYVYRNYTDYEVLRADDRGVSRPPLPTPMPTVPYPTFLRAAGSSWVQGYAGLFQAGEDGRGAWARVKDTPAQGFSSLIGNDRELVSVLSGPPGVNSGALSFDGRAWRRYPGEFSGAWFGEDSGRLFLRARNGIHVRTTFQSSTLEYIPLPAATPPHSLVEDTDSALWIGCPDGVLHYLPDCRPPETRVTAPVTKVTQGSSLPLNFQGLHLFDTESSGAAFQFSWKIDGKPAGGFRHLGGPALDISALAPGSHRLEVSARDSAGNIDPTPAILDFTIMPLPLQSRPWFPWALASIAALLMGLAWIGITRSRRLARGNAKLRREIGHRARIEKALEEARAQLELRVAERTADLSRTNDELKHEIHERHELEKLRTGLEEQLLQAQKMQAIGTLAGGIAHDFNNILAIITPCTRMALEECIANPEARENLQQVLAASERARRLVQQILTFSRRQPTHKVPVDLGEAVTEALKFMRAALSSGVRLEIDIEPGLPPILADVTQLQQVIINLCTNAQQALPEGRGTIGVTLRHGGTPELAPDAFLAPPPHPHLTLLVSDDGVGMPPELLERIFDPFFTTKPTGKGTGLGLSVVDGIVKSHGGHILVSSTPGEGSTFAVSLPIHLPDPASPAAQLSADTPELPNLALVLPPPATGPAATPGSQPGQPPSTPAVVPASSLPTPPTPTRPPGTRILLVDDEPSVSRPLRIMLERAGFAVQVHNTPQSAHRAFLAAPEDYDLLLTDHSMAGMTGPDLARLLRNERPDLPVILVTGYGGAWTPGDAARIGIHKILTKPVDPAELVAEVRGAVSRADLSRGSGASGPSAS